MGASAPAPLFVPAAPCGPAAAPRFLAPRRLGVGVGNGGGGWRGDGVEGWRGHVVGGMGDGVGGMEGERRGVHAGAGGGGNPPPRAHPLGFFCFFF